MSYHLTCRTVVAALGASVLLSACSAPTDTSQPDLSAVLSYLMDSRGMGQFELPAVYCVAGDEGGGAAPIELRESLVSPEGVLVVSSEECSYSEEAGRLVGPSGLSRSKSSLLLRSRMAAS